jgi:hypothetical protein
MWAEKNQNSIKPESMLRPDWLWDRKARRKARDKIEKESLAKYQTTINEASKQAPIVNNQQHPVTGDLSRFLESTVEKKDE